MKTRFLTIALLGSSGMVPVAAAAQQQVLRLPPGMLRPRPMPTPIATPTPVPTPTPTPTPTVMSLPPGMLRPRPGPVPIATPTPAAAPIALPQTRLAPLALRPSPQGPKPTVSDPPARVAAPSPRLALPTSSLLGPGLAPPPPLRVATPLPTGVARTPRPVFAGATVPAVTAPPAAGSEEAALVQRLGLPKVETSAGLLRRTGPVPRVLADGIRAPLRSRCASADRTQDAVSFGKSSDGQYVVRFSCGAAVAGGKASVYTVTMQGGAKGALVAGRGPRRIGRGAPALAPASSRTFAEVSTCLDQFAKYKSGDYIFNIDRIGTYPHCSATPATKLSVLTGAAVKPFDPKQIRVIGTPDIADALIDPQRPERMLRYADFDTQPIDGQSSHIHTVDEVANEWIHPIDGLPPINDPKGIQIAPVKPGYGVDFLTRGKPTYDRVVLQLVQRSAPPHTISVSLNGVTSTVSTAGLSKPDFVPGGTVPDQCSAALAPPGLVGFAISKIVPVKIAKGTDAGWAVQGPVWLSHIELDSTQFPQLLGGRKDGNYWLRVVPAKTPAYGGAVVPDCAGPTGRPVPVRIGYSKEQIASYNAYAEKVGQSVLQQKVDDAAAAAAAQLPGGPAGSSPAIVEMVGWLPPDSPEETWVMTQVPHDPKTGPLGGPLAWIDPEKFVKLTHENIFNLSDAYPGATWPKRQNWSAGKAYSPYGFIDAEKEKEKVESAWDYISLAINGWSMIYDEMKTGLVQSFAYLVSFGQCEPDIPLEEPKIKTKACKIIDKYASAGLDYGMKALGLPPKLPTTADLADQASDYLVTTAMSTLPEGSETYLPSSAKEKATKWLSNKLKKSVLGMTCAQPARLDIPAKDQGYDVVDPVTLCGYKTDTFTSFARLDGTPVSPYYATMYVRVRPNPAKVAGADTKITLFADSRQTAVPALYQKYMTGLSYGFTPLPMAAPVTIDMANVPAEGVVVPLVMLYPESQMRWAYSDAPACHTQLVGPCVSGAYAMWKDLLMEGRQRMTLLVGYRFGDDITLTQTLGTKKEIVASAPALTRYEAKTWEASLGVVQPGMDYAIKTFLPEPGFTVLNTKTPAGLPTNEVVPAFDLDDYY